MIIKSSIIKATPKSMANVVRHLLDKPDENEAIGIINGSRQEVGIAFDDAEQFGRKNAVAHFIFSSKEALTPAQMRDAINMTKDEFGFSSDDVKLTVRHQKQRHDDDGNAWDQHFHLLVSMVNPENGRVLDVSKSFARQEKVCRIFEAKHGLEIIKGKHNRAVISAVEDPEIREKLRGAGISSGKRPSAAFTTTEKEVGKRRGHDLADVRNEMRSLWKRCDGWQAFNAAVSEKGWTIENGTKKPDVLILNDENGKYIGSVSRLLGMKKADLDRHIAENATQKPVEASPDHPKARTPDTENTYPSAPRQAHDRPLARKPARKPGSSITDRMRPELVQKSSNHTANNMTAEERKSAEITEKLEEEARQSINEGLIQQKKEQDAFFEMLDSFKSKNGDKKMNKITLPDSFKTVCHGEIKNFERIRDMPLPDQEIREFERMNDKERFQMAYGKVIKAVRDRKQYVKKLEAEIKDLKSNAHWWNKNGQKAETKEADEKRLKEQIAQIALWLAKKIMSKFNLCDNPGNFQFMASEDWNKMEVDEKTKELADVIQEIAECDATGYKKMAANGVKMMEKATEAWKERPEAVEARNGISGIESLLNEDELAERIADLSHEDIEKLKEDIKMHDPCGAVKTIIAGELNAGDRRENEREIKKANEAELAEIMKREQQEAKKEQQKTRKKGGSGNLEP